MDTVHLLTSGLHLVTDRFHSFPEKYLSKHLASHNPYLPGVQPSCLENVLKLNTNENPYPPSPALIEKLGAEFVRLNLYPNPQSTNVRKTVASLHKLNSEQVIVGNGSDDLLNLCIRCFAGPKNPVGMLEPSYSLYHVLASIQGAEVHRIPFKSEEFEIPIEEIHNSGANIFFIVTPHAPSGRSYHLETLRKTVEGFDGIVVLDEAYVDFSRQNALSLLPDYENLIITRTLSKSYSLAGLRVGYALADSRIINVLDQAREVYNVDRLAQVGAVSALKDQSYFRETVGKIIACRNQISETFLSWGWKVVPSEANFIFVRPVRPDGSSGPEIAKSLFEFLNKKNVLVRYFPSHPLTHSYLRISVGKPDEMSMMLHIVKEWQAQEQQK